jgi:hypothetical protein
MHILQEVSLFAKRSYCLNLLSPVSNVTALIWLTTESNGGLL